MGEITVASTTDTQKVIDNVAGLEPQEEVKSQPEQEQEQKETKGEQKASESEPEKPKASKSAYQKRIDTLNRRINELEQKVAPPQEKVEAEPAPVPQKAKPTPADFPNSYEDYIEALTDWKAEQREIQKAEEQEQSAENARLRQVFDNFGNQMSAAREKYGDFDEALSASVPIHTGVELQIRELDNGAEVAYYLGKHRDVAQKLMEMSVVRAMAEVGKISAKLENVTQVDEASTSEQEEEEEEVPVHKASPPPRRAVSQAPPPITPVGGSSTKSSVPLDDLPYSEYRRIRDQQVKNRYRK